MKSTANKTQRNLLKKPNNTAVTIIYGNQKARIILDSNYSEYYQMTVWAHVRAMKANYYLCEYECPNTFTLMREWIHENYFLEPHTIHY